MNQLLSIFVWGTFHVLLTRRFHIEETYFLLIAAHLISSINLMNDGGLSSNQEVL